MTNSTATVVTDSPLINEYNATAQATTTIAMTRGDLLDAFKACALHMSADVTRFHLHGVLVECATDCARFVATDGHTLIRLDLPAVVTNKCQDGAIIPAATVKAAIKALACTRRKRGESVTLKIDANAKTATIKVGENTVCGKLVDAKFPPYEQVIPNYSGKGACSVIGCDPDLMVRGCHSLAPFTSESLGIALQIGPDALSPFLLKLNNGNILALVVIMPMRL